MPNELSGSADRRSPSSRPMDRDQFAALYVEAYSRLWITAASIVLDRALADDVVQEAAIVGMRKIDHFTVGTNFPAWMSEIVRRCALNHARKKKNRKTIPADPNTIDETTENAISPSATVVTRSGRLIENQTEFDDQVLNGLKQLSEVARCCVLLRTVQQLSYEEISETLNIPKGTAMSHVHRSKATLRKLLRETDDK